ncbi:MAG: hypothetical protein E3J64_00775 [Anaerolineales bacterium]|nr:MAG: hypothetical protein E3J64_00775 [Anaerolineales bacterium]
MGETGFRVMGDALGVLFNAVAEQIKAGAEGLLDDAGVDPVAADWMAVGILGKLREHQAEVATLYCSDCGC